VTNTSQGSGLITEQTGNKVRGLFLWLGLGLAAVLLAIYFSGGRFALEKTLKALVAPVGLVWLGLLLQTSFFFWSGQRRAAGYSLVLWLLLTIAGNQLFTRWAIQALEGPFSETRIDSLGEFDVILVLGGSTGTTPSGEPQGGERVFAALRLYKAGKVKTLLVSGQQFSKAFAKDLEPAEEAKLLLVQSGVPEAAVQMLGGLNTSEEIASLKNWLLKNEADDFRLGILSDASHLLRAISLCKQQGIDAVGIPSTIDTAPLVPNPSIVIPSSSNLSATQTFIYEVLGRLIGR
jgi:vancomycin permeability regulator SanA